MGLCLKIDLIIILNKIETMPKMVEVIALLIVLACVSAENPPPC
jgi:hypothetical protein